MQRNILCAAIVAAILSTLARPIHSAQDPQGAPDLPNILWITSEDNSYQWLGCYGNEQAQTPRLDALAKNGVLFNRAYSNGPVCAIARSTLLMGNYAVTMGTQHQRSRYVVPGELKPYVHYLRSMGYYCTNNSKTDYNIKGNDRKIWNACNNRAHYKNRPEGSPFFAVFNLMVSHESSLFSGRVANHRKRGMIPKKPRIAPEDVNLPPYLPDVPEVRNDVAIYTDTITAMDRQVGSKLDELEQLGLAEDTIVFYYGDHGGATPRGKRYLTDSGVRVPLLIHFPKKWQHLSPFAAGEQVDEPVAFVDLAPTLLSLCGMKTPKTMQGRAFLGKHRAEPADDEEVFLFADRYDELSGMRRGITDGRYKYIRCFTPHLPAAPYSYYSLGQPSWKAWEKAWQDGKLTQEFNAIWETPQPVDRLFDLEADPWEVNNLADDPQHAKQLAKMQSRLKNRMVETHDTGLICEPLFPSLVGEGTIYEFAHSTRFDVARIADLAFLASAGNAKNLPSLEAALESDDPVQQYWGAVGCLVLGNQASGASDQLAALLSSDESVIRITAAHALHDVGKAEQGKKALLAELQKPLSNEAALTLVQAITFIDAVEDVPQHWIKKTIEEPSAGVYLKKFANRLQKGS